MQKPVSTRSTQPALTALREETFSIHQKLHLHPVTRPLVESTLSREHYIFTLQVFQCFYRAVEHNLKLFDTCYYQWKSNVNLLQSDLEFLGALPHQLPPIPKFMLIKDINEFIGVMYVLEGSKLGGQVIYKNIKKTLKLDKNSGASFFNGNGKKTTVRWLAFIDFLEKKSNDIKKAQKSAKLTFEYLDNWMILSLSKKLIYTQHIYPERLRLRCRMHRPFNS